MKKVIYFVLLSFFLCGVSYADNSARVSELKMELQKMDAQFKEYGQAMKELEAKALMVQGAIQELENMDKPKVKKDGAKR